MARDTTHRSGTMLFCGMSGSPLAHAAMARSQGRLKEIGRMGPPRWTAARILHRSHALLRIQAAGSHRGRRRHRHTTLETGRRTIAQAAKRHQRSRLHRSTRISLLKSALRSAKRTRFAAMLTGSSQLTGALRRNVHAGSLLEMVGHIRVREPATSEMECDRVRRPARAAVGALRTRVSSVW
jgi:hypothetical protein